MDVVLDALNGFRGKVNSTKMKVNREDEYLFVAGRAVRVRRMDANFTVHYPSQFFLSVANGGRNSLAVRHLHREFL